MFTHLTVSAGGLGGSLYTIGHYSRNEQHPDEEIPSTFNEAMADLVGAEPSTPRSDVVTDPQEAAQNPHMPIRDEASFILTHGSQKVSAVEQGPSLQRPTDTNHPSYTLSSAGAPPGGSNDTKETLSVAMDTGGQESMRLAETPHSTASTVITNLNRAREFLVSTVPPLDLRYVWTNLDEILGALKGTLDWVSFRSNFQFLKHRIQWSATTEQLPHLEFKGMMEELYGESTDLIRLRDHAEHTFP